MSLATRLAHRRIHYGWIVAAVTFVVLLSSAGVRATPSILIVPLEREFSWTAAARGAHHRTHLGGDVGDWRRVDSSMRESGALA